MPKRKATRTFEGEPFDPDAEYERQMGKEAFKRQRHLARVTCTACGVRVGDGLPHHNLCPKQDKRFRRQDPIKRWDADRRATG